MPLLSYMISYFIFIVNKLAFLNILSLTLHFLQKYYYLKIMEYLLICHRYLLLALLEVFLQCQEYTIIKFFI